MEVRVKSAFPVNTPKRVYQPWSVQYSDTEKCLDPENYCAQQMKSKRLLLLVASYLQPFKIMCQSFSRTILGIILYKVGCVRRRSLTQVRARLFQCSLIGGVLCNWYAPPRKR